MAIILDLFALLQLGSPEYATRVKTHHLLTANLPHSSPVLKWAAKAPDRETSHRAKLILSAWDARIHGPAKTECVPPWPPIELLPDHAFTGWGIGGYTFPRKMFLDQAQKKIGKCSEASRLATKLFAECMVNCYGPWYSHRITDAVRDGQEKEKPRHFAAKTQ